LQVAVAAHKVIQLVEAAEEAAAVDLELQLLLRSQAVYQ
jgi:hypothetical protein